jgi:pimeloyl-ACP methyl ester carboxylesterase
MSPETRYATSGDVKIAYQVTGSGPIDLVWAPGTVSHLDLDWDWAPRARFFERLGESFRLIRLDKRGTGLSDRPTDAASLEERTEDIRAVMDAAGSQRAVVFGLSEGGSMACLFAATYPERTRALVLWGTQARWTQAEDYKWGATREQQLAMIKDLAAHGVNREYLVGPGYGLGQNPDPGLLEWCFRYSRAGASATALAALESMVLDIDTRDVLPSIRVPTLVMNRTGDPVANVEAARDLSVHIPGASFEEFPGATHGFSDITEVVVTAVENFVEGAPALPGPSPTLATVLCVEITPRSAPGAPSTPDLYDRVDAVVQRTVAFHHGRDVRVREHGFRAVFDGPIRAIHCARAAREALLGLGTDTRAGLHTGECEVVGGEPRGAAVDVAARIASAARPGEILVSSTVRNLVVRSDFRFEDRGDAPFGPATEGHRRLRAMRQFGVVERPRAAHRN